MIKFLCGDQTVEFENSQLEILKTGELKNILSSYQDQEIVKLEELTVKAPSSSDIQH